jgi:hypothetical protein
MLTLTATMSNPSQDQRHFSSRLDPHSERWAILTAISSTQCVMCVISLVNSIEGSLSFQRCAAHPW